ncbi:DUF2637 domain-containing protein [Micromonospora sp. WMMD729]|uniref:DUF2637 domain-containing protein n=1 Tax=Micromonospora sp. WMMD729 TaxID=3404127 RepID=UPI003BF5F44D
MLAIGGAAGAASFTHVHNVAAAHGQPGWLAWADAIVLELMSIASGLELRRRKRAHTSTVFPATVLACAVTLSLAAQVVEAEPSIIGWVAAAVPALGFLVMVKIALGRTSTATPAHPGTVGDRRPRPDEAGRTAADSGPDEATRSAVTAGERRSMTRTVRSPEARRRHGGRDRQRRADRGRSAQPSGDVAELLPAARTVRDRLAADGQALTRAALAEALRAAGHTVSNTRLSELLKTLKVESSALPEPIASPAVPTNPTPPPLSPERRNGGGAATPAPVDPDAATPLLPHSHPSQNQENPDHEQPHESR